MLFALKQVGMTSRRLVWGFGVFNLVFAPLAWAAALSGWLGLSRAGDWALGWAGRNRVGAWHLAAERTTAVAAGSPIVHAAPPTTAADAGLIDPP